jgi:hypothetical protein
MTELVPVRRVPRVIEGEVLASHYQLPSIRDWNPSPLMRLLGYTKNPDTCGHSHRSFTPRDGWWCKDCGDTL